ncbi:MAG TPA: HAD hydrolase-like protein [Candidatus Limnocylindrales bacterium]|nr:HAD hydrolase-like protein [Candidatus Limnocylindrales bacterium]
MQAAERPPGQAERKLKTAVKRGVNRVIRPYRPNLHVRDVASINWGQLDEGKGVIGVLDRDGTTVPLYGWDVPDSARSNILGAKKARILREVHVATNSAPRDEIGFVRLVSSNAQIEADSTQVPLSRKDRKPGPNMILNVVASSDNDDAVVAVVGDKLTGDIRAAKIAGADVTILVDRQGKTDLFGDRFRRVIEGGMKWWMDRVPDDFIDDAPHETPIQAIRRLKREGVEIAEKPSPRRKYTEHLPPELWVSSKISGHGGRIIMLPKEVVDAIPPRVNIPGTEQAKKMVQAISESIPGKVAGKIIYHGGGAIGDYMSLSRVKDGAEILYDLARPEPNIKRARRTHLKSIIKDLLDGTTVKHSKRGATNRGAMYDLIGDRALDIMSGLGAVKIGRLDPVDYAVRTGREVVSSGVRWHYNRKGVDVKANAVGKASSAVAMPALNLALREIAVKKPELNKKTQRVVTYIKVGSFLYSWVQWHRRAKFRTRDMPRYEKEKAILVSQTQKKI